MGRRADEELHAINKTQSGCRPRLYVERTARGDRHHRDSRGHVAARIAKAKMKATMAACLNNQKQRGLAWMRFADDNRDSLVSFSTRANDSWRIDPSAGIYVIPAIPLGTGNSTAAQPGTERRDFARWRQPRLDYQQRRDDFRCRWLLPV